VVSVIYRFCRNAVDAALQPIFSKLECEMFNLYNTYLDYKCFYDLHTDSSLSAEDRLEQSYKAADKIIKRIHSLPDGQEYPCVSGFSGRSGVHCMYVNFVRRGSDIIVRIDNGGAGYRVRGRHHHMPRQLTGSEDVWPYVVAHLSDQQLVRTHNNYPSLLAYVVSVSYDSFKPCEEALPRIYQPHGIYNPNDHHLWNNWSAYERQNNPNCPVYNYDQIGFKYRLGPELATNVLDFERDWLNRYDNSQWICGKVVILIYMCYAQ